MTTVGSRWRSTAAATCGGAMVRQGRNLDRRRVRTEGAACQEEDVVAERRWWTYAGGQHVTRRKNGEVTRSTYPITRPVVL
jgi:hypothetical protein